MKKNTHPTYHPKAKIKCACGAAFETGSVKAELQTEICSHCHPFYTGKEKLIDAAGRVDRFKKIMEKKEDHSKKKPIKKAKNKK